jgi:hypothetical protein
MTKFSGVALLLTGIFFGITAIEEWGRVEQLAGNPFQSLVEITAILLTGVSITAFFAGLGFLGVPEHKKIVKDVIAGLSLSIATQSATPMASPNNTPQPSLTSDQTIAAQTGNWFGRQTLLVRIGIVFLAAVVPILLILR